jgi:hypothetical protein
MDALYRGEDGSFVICPYCSEPLTVELEVRRLVEYRRDPYARTPVICRVCALDLTADAPSEVMQVEGRSRAACRHCGKSILADAFYCHHCQHWQNPPFVR